MSGTRAIAAAIAAALLCAALASSQLPAQATYPWDQRLFRAALDEEQSFTRDKVDAPTQPLKEVETEWAGHCE